MEDLAELPAILVGAPWHRVARHNKWRAGNDEQQRRVSKRCSEKVDVVGHSTGPTTDYRLDVAYDGYTYGSS
jgi:hypothetical protein